MNLRRSTTACGLLLAIGLVTAATALSAPRSQARREAAARRKATTYYARRIQKLRTETWYWQRVMGVRPSGVRVRTLAAVSVERIRQLDALWRRRLQKAARNAHNPPQLRAWLCIHHYEGSWQDSGAPYYGGLQMSYSFQQAYGAWLLRQKGTADHWSPLEQIWTAVRAYRTRGFAPWPHTARACGLI